MMREVLWPEGHETGPGEAPSLTLYPAPPELANGAAMVICPGGGYGGLADHEGEPVALWLNALGVTCVVLRYRLGPHSRHPMMLLDAARAVRTTRSRAREWNIDAARVGILGFSAGGHLASSLATHFDAGDENAVDSIDRLPSRPDVAVLVYPVITLRDPHTHAGSRQNLLGDDPPQELLALLSNETQVTPETPPTFLVHSADDEAVPIENSLLFALALRRDRVPFAMQVYEHGGHGYGLGGDDPVLSAWPAQCAAWLRGRGFLTAPDLR